MESEKDLALMNSSTAGEDNGKTQFYWTKKQEIMLKIWERQKLAKDRKYPKHFVDWATELKNRFNVIVSPEEMLSKRSKIQAKYRQMRKKLQNGNGKENIRCKKFDAICQILVNQFRRSGESIPLKDAESNGNFVKKRRSISLLSQAKHSISTEENATTVVVAGMQQEQGIAGTSGQNKRKRRQVKAVPKKTLEQQILEFENRNQQLLSQCTEIMLEITAKIEQMDSK
ncbi:uncharacterized protein LOC119672365 [Teleopsis dalmanni]|uniref:uncharacterized protein LOC119667972 n=1 Tax=Teleopsis dalmanni TaxID=139649 RepID=UPI0018CFE01A|nr:uncharacterized protein LOC119667972 [Teleopsis dalmanni]XP_037939315.1 uncharacterized protein LOC119672362 [Teleopsis dalmanni]XP_037939318.1 uncharacterized protein LOC119672365 [Teleopsis dalmanni]